jgi:hypothetical protein
MGGTIMSGIPLSLADDVRNLARFANRFDPEVM